VALAPGRGVREDQRRDVLSLAGRRSRRRGDEALAADPTVAKNPRGAFRLHYIPEDLFDRFMDGLRKAGLDESGA